MVSGTYKRLLYTMKVTIIQLNIAWGNPAENIKRAEQLMGKNPDSDLYVLPEMWSTGFATEPTGIAEEESSSVSLEWMKKTARAHHCAICGSLAVKVDGIYRNRHYFVDGENETVSYYDKHHLFGYGHEDEYYKPGDEHTIVEYKGFRFLLLTCYDLRFPVWIRYSDALNYDGIIIVANWPENRQNAWEILTRARAIENQAFVMACNRVGDDPRCHYSGQSAIISPIGKTLACLDHHEDILTFDIEMEMLQHLRTKFPVLQDRDNY